MTVTIKLFSALPVDESELEFRGVLGRFWHHLSAKWLLLRYPEVWYLELWSKNVWLKMFFLNDDVFDQCWGQEFASIPDFDHIWMGVISEMVKILVVFFFGNYYFILVNYFSSNLILTHQKFPMMQSFQVSSFMISIH